MSWYIHYQDNYHGVQRKSVYWWHMASKGYNEGRQFLTNAGAFKFMTRNPSCNWKFMYWWLHTHIYIQVSNSMHEFCMVIKTCFNYYLPCSGVKLSEHWLTIFQLMFKSKQIFDYIRHFKYLSMRKYKLHCHIPFARFAAYHTHKANAGRCALN